MRILDIAREWIDYRDHADRLVELGFENLAEAGSFVVAEIAKAEILARLAALQVSA